MGPNTPSIAWQAGPAVSFGGQQAVTEGNLVVSTRTNSVGDTTDDVIVGRDLVSGTERWTVHLPINFADSWSGRVSAIRGAQVYATRAGNTNSEYLYALSAADGSILWRSVGLIDEYFSESLAFADNDDPIVGNMQSLTRIDHTNGTTVWKTPRQGAASGGNMAAVSGNHVYAWDQNFGTDYGPIVAVFDATNGQELYTSATQAVALTQVGLVAGADGTVYATLNNGVLIAFADTGSALVEKWRTPTGYTPYASFGIGPDGSVYAYSAQNEILRLDPATGGVRNTSMPIPFDNVAFFPRMAIDSAGRVFLTNGGLTAGALFSFNADLTLRWSDAVPGVFLGGPALAFDGTVVVCGYADVRAYRSGDWSTGFGGNPDRAGLSTAMGPEVPSVLWHAGIPAEYGGQPVIDGDVVASTRSEVPGPDGAWVVAQAIGTGAELWRKKLPINFDDSWFSHVPAIRDGQVYATRAGNVNQEYLYALSAADGSILWQSQDLIDFAGGESPTFASNGDLIVGNWGSLTRIDHVTGSTVWSVPHYCPAVGGCGAAVAGGRVYVWDLANTGGSFNLAVSAFDIATGTYLYSSEALSQSLSVASQIGVVAGPNGTVYAPMADKTPADAFVALQDTGSALIEKWRIPMGYVPFASFGVASDGTVYTYSVANEVQRVDPASGVVLNTSVAIPCDGAVFSPRIAIDSAGRVFLTNGGGVDGALYSFNADLTLRWSDGIRGVGESGPAIHHNGTVVVAGWDEVRAYRTSSALGSMQQSTSTGIAGLGETPDISTRAAMALSSVWPKAAPRRQVALATCHARLVAVWGRAGVPIP